MVLIGGLSGDAVRSSFKCDKCGWFGWRSLHLKQHLQKEHGKAVFLE